VGLRGAVDEVARERMLVEEPHRDVAVRAAQPAGADGDRDGAGELQVRGTGRLEVQRPRDVAVGMTEEPALAIAKEREHDAAVEPRPPAGHPELHDVAEADAGGAPFPPDERVQEPDDGVHRPERPAPEPRLARCWQLHSGKIAG
jgi:hypothetical protein